jgi:exonuclease SbcC
MTQRKEVMADASAYAQLTEAFGRNGIQEMIIEKALPEIEEAANELLARLSDGRMRVTLQTQRQGRSGGPISTLDVIVGDELGERPYELFSGGEKFRINFAIRIALSRLLARRSGVPLQMLAIDEGFGSQDRQGCDRLVEAIKTVQDDFARVLVITHLDELKDAFPVQIEVSKDHSGSTFTIS